MAFDPSAEETARKRAAAHEIGQDLAALSIDEIDDRIAVLEGEIDRLRQAKTRKESSKSAADMFFKPKS